MTTIEQRRDDEPGEKDMPLRGVAMGRGTTIAGGASFGSPRSLRHWSRTSSGSSPR